MYNELKMKGLKNKPKIKQNKFFYSNNFYIFAKVKFNSDMIITKLLI